MSSPLPKFGALLIGDELLTGKRSDRHWPKLIELLAVHGLELSWLRVIGDSGDEIESELKRIFAADDYVFSFGGIGATPDDRTRQSAAAAAGQALVLHAGAVAEIEAQYGDAAQPQRVKMAELPASATLIPNPINRVPGFSLGNTHFVPGFPEMAWPMIAWLLRRDFPERSSHDAAVEYLVRIYAIGEGDLIQQLEAMEADFPKVKISSLPSRDQNNRYVELGVRGAKADAVPAAHKLQEYLAGLEQPVTWLLAPEP